MLLLFCEEIVMLKPYSITIRTNQFDIVIAHQSNCKTMTICDIENTIFAGVLNNKESRELALHLMEAAKQLLSYENE
jgi:sulfur relay (sulfurtransferase) DsrF/TusC family protein